jgi:hypothetical protein
MQNIFGALLIAVLLVGCTQQKKTEVPTLPAKISFISGNVKVSRDMIASPASVNMLLHKDDVIMTGRDGKANILFPGIGISHIGPGSVVTVLRLMRTDSADNVGMDLKNGYLLSSLKKFSRDSDDFYVETPSAVVGVRGTTFIVKVDPHTGMKAECFSGKVELQDKKKAEKPIEVTASQVAILPGNDFLEARVESLPKDAQLQVKDLEGANELADTNMKSVNEEINSVISGTRPVEEKKTDKKIQKPVVQTKPKTVEPKAPQPVLQTNTVKPKTQAKW